MIKIKTPMQILVDTRDQLEKEADKQLEGEKLEGYKEALTDIFEILCNYF